MKVFYLPLIPDLPVFLSVGGFLLAGFTAAAMTSMKHNPIKVLQDFSADKKFFLY